MNAAFDLLILDLLSGPKKTAARSLLAPRAALQTQGISEPDVQYCTSLLPNVTVLESFTFPENVQLSSDSKRPLQTTYCV